MKKHNSFLAKKLAAAAGLAALFCCCGGGGGFAQAQSVYSYPGLIQAKFNANNWAAACSPDIMSDPTAERVYGAVMADVLATESTWNTVVYVNPLSGNTWNWNRQYTGWGYAGEMRVEEGVKYTFGKYLDDGARIIIDGTNILNNAAAGEWATGSYTATNSAWVAIDIRAYDGTGEKGPRGDWRPDFGLAFNTNGHAVALPKTAWTRLLDSGDGSLFRVATYMPTATAPAFGEAPAALSFDGTDFAISAELAHGVADVFALAGFGGVYTVTNRIAVAATVGAPVVGAFATLATNTAYTAAALADNGSDAPALVVSGTPFFTGELWLEHVRDAQEEGFVQGVVNVRRTNTVDATRLPLTVNYSFAGIDAVEGVNYVAPSGVVEIPAGADSAQILVVPLVDSTSAGDTRLSVALEAGFYFHSAAAVAVAIEKWTPDAAFNTWIAPAAGNASVAANWTQGVPTAGQRILLGVFSSADMAWDAGVNGLPDTVASWTQEELYKGAVTFMTTFPDYDAAFTNFTVAGDALIEGGSWTHAANAASEAYRLRVSVGGDFTLGAGAKLDVQRKGYAAGSVHPGSGYGIHGGSRNNFAQVYGNVYAPENLGSGGELQGNGKHHAGGGAVFLTVAGDALINGHVNANTHIPGGQYEDQNSGAGGSILIRAASISGTGLIYANGAISQKPATSGGRIALIATAAQTLGFPAANVYARGNSSNPGTSAAAGTVFLKNASQTYGTLVVDNILSDLGNHYFFNPSKFGTTCIPDGETWTFDSIITRNQGILSIPPNTTLVLPNGFASVASADTSLLNGILYLGGDIVPGGATPYTFQNNWVFHAGEPYAINSDVFVVNQGALGCLPLTSTLGSHVPCDIAINGNLAVDATSRITAENAGVDWDEGNLALFATHGGQSGGTPAGRPTDPLLSRAYGSILNPVLPGMFMSDNLRELRRDTRAAGGGAIKLRVNGAFELDGLVTASAICTTYERNGGNAGSVNIAAATLAGSGAIEAAGSSLVNNNGNKYQPAGGRVAVRLTAPGADFSQFNVANIKAHGSSGYANVVVNPDFMTSAGTIYLETPEDGENGGKVIIWNDNQAKNNTAFTPLPSQALGGDADDLSKVSLDIGQCARVKLFASMRVNEALARAGTTLDLNGQTLTLRKLALSGQRVAQTGAFTAAQLLAFGYAGIADTDPAAAGLVVLVPDSTLLIIR